MHVSGLHLSLHLQTLPRAGTDSHYLLSRSYDESEIRRKTAGIDRTIQGDLGLAGIAFIFLR